MKTLETEAVNIGPREQTKRRLLGIVALVCAAGVAFITVFSGAPRLTRAFVFLPVWLAGLGMFQAREKTCIALAARGACNMDAGEEPLKDERAAASLREKARRINRRSLLVAAVSTAVALLFP